MKEEYVFEPHKMTAMIAGKKICAYCGLVYSNNKFTQWALKMGCDNKSHPQYASKRKQYTSLHINI